MMKHTLALTLFAAAALSLTGADAVKSAAVPAKAPSKTAKAPEKKVVYEKGYVWDMTHIEKKGVSTNPDLDTKGTPVWYYLYKHGPQNGIVHDGKYLKDVSSGKNVPYAGYLCHFSPTRDKKYKYIYGWICREKQKNGTCALCFHPRKMAMQILEWKSPVDGKVSVQADVRLHPGPVNAVFEVARNAEKPLFQQKTDRKKGLQQFKLELKDVEVKKGDSLFFLCDCFESTAWAKLQNFSIRLQ